MSKVILVQPYNAGNSDNTVKFLQYLQAQSPNQRLLLLWDGASYHRFKSVREYLSQVNDSGPTEQWQIHCVCFAPNYPQQNPIEDVWFQAKTWIRRFCGLARSFLRLK